MLAQAVHYIGHGCSFYVCMPDKLAGAPCTVLMDKPSDLAGGSGLAGSNWGFVNSRGVAKSMVQSSGSANESALREGPACEYI